MFSKSFTVEVLNVVVVDDVDVVVVVVVGPVPDVVVVLVVDSESRPSSIMNSVVVITGTNSGFSSSISFSPLFVIPNISKMLLIISFALSSEFAMFVGFSSSSSSSQTTLVIFLLTFLGIFSTICSHSSC